MLVLALLVAGCVERPTALVGDGAIAEIIYRFGDASVPPEYHRSYTITVTPTQVRRITDSYGDVLEDQVGALDEEQFLALVASLRASGLGVVDSGDSDGCTGGTTETLEIVMDDGERSEGSVSHCGREDSGTLRGDLTSFVVDLNALLPTLTR